MYNLRYHIASLVAVFLALAIGMLLGTIVVERGVLDTQRNTLVKSLQTDFTGLKKENDELRRDRDREHAFASDALPVLVEGALAGKSVLVITNAGRNDALPVTRDTLRDAGASAVLVTFKSKDFGMSSESVQKAVSAVTTRPPGSSGPTDPLVTALVAEWTDPARPQLVTEALRDAGQLSIESTSPVMAFDAVVLLAAFDGDADPALVALTAGLQKKGRPAVGVETQGASAGVPAASLGSGFSSVDHVDRPEGAFSLVRVLSGTAEGHFGVKPGATSAYPRIR